jgi:hypothetical protein
MGEQMTQAAFYVVATEHAKFGKFTYENDHIAKPLDLQLRKIADLVWTAEWDNVTACYLVDPFAGTCTDALRDLAEAVDRQSEYLEVEPHADTADFIRRVLGRDAWTPEREEAPGLKSAWATRNLAAE